MPKIIPIRDLKSTSTISALCQSTDEPIFVTKNGYGDMVIMSISTYESMLDGSTYQASMRQLEQSLQSGNMTEALLVMENMRDKYKLD
ncbi:MAG: type II toxin-antitoxin system Phd/YefM family antitoxin [Bacilli bacterium]